MQGDKKHKFSVSIACFNNWDLTKRCLDSLYGKNKGIDFEVIVTNNASTDETYEELERKRTRRPHLRLVHMGLNVGFGEAHNRALSIASGEYFVVLNNDFYIEDSEWLDKLVKPFESNPKLAVCGVKGNPTYINNEAEGRWHDNILDYVEASCLVIPVELARRYGLFSPEMQFAYYEDSDMSLRYRQMGYEIEVVPFAFEHVRGKTAGLINKDRLEAIRMANKRRFMIRWGNYLKSRRFSNRILVETRFIAGLGDLLSLTPSLRSLRRAHPTAEIVLNTSIPELFNGNSYVDVIRNTKPDNSVDMEEWDSVLTPGLSAYYQGMLTIPVKHAYDMGLVLDSVLLEMLIDDGLMADYLSKAGLKGEKYIVVALQTGHEQIGWEGRSLSSVVASELCRWIIDRGFKVVQVGSRQEGLLVGHPGFKSLVDKTGITELAYVIKGSSGAVVVDSLPMHLAQALKVKTLALFGATLPENRATDFSCIDWLYHPGLDCIGCYHYKAEGGYNKCLRGDTACMNDLPPGLLKEKINAFLDGDITRLPENHLAVIRRAEDLIFRSEAISQDVMTAYRVLRDRIENSLALRMGRKLAGFRLFRMVWKPVSRMIKKRLLKR